MGLVLSRKPGETINIGADITVTVLYVKGDQVKINIEAPRSVVVDRAEIAVRKQAERDALKQLLAQKEVQS
jgi:carbon storage regulator